MKTVIHASIFLVNEKDELLLVQEGKEKVKGLWNLPGGKMEHAEQIPEAAIRETLEETGLTVKPLGLLSIFTSNKDDTDYVHFVFLAKEYSGTIQNIDSVILDVQWMPLKMVQLMDSKEILNAAKIHHSSMKYRLEEFVDLNVITHMEFSKIIN